MCILNYPVELPCLQSRRYFEGHFGENAFANTSRMQSPPIIGSFLMPNQMQFNSFASHIPSKRTAASLHPRTHSDFKNHIAKQHVLFD